MKIITNTLIAAAALSTGPAFAMTSNQSAIDALRADTLSSSEQLRVHVKGNTAYLAGTVESATQKRSAERALKKLDGITQVISLVNVN